MTYDAIADYLNEHGYQTTRGKKFKNAHVPSIVKRKRQRDERLSKEYPPVIKDFEIVFL